MLEPQTRATLTDLLRPPPGFALEHAVGTTFTLGLDSALSVPLAFAAHLFATESDPLSILDTIRKVSDRVDVFAQAGEISLGAQSKLVAFLEPMLHPVRVDRGIFHPKVWFLEFRRGSERAYRFVCTSRNLTADRSWDVVISLDGVPGFSGDAGLEARNAPLVGLLRALPGLAVLPLPEDRRERIGSLADRWRHIEWEYPTDVEDLAFHVWGAAGVAPRPSFGGGSVLLISPFLQAGGIAELRGPLRRTEAAIVSRESSLDALPPEALGDRTRAFVLDEAADSLDESEAVSSRPADGREPLTGLHAKTFVFDRGWKSHVFLGSLNATSAALHSNVEVLVEVVGPKKKFGVEATMAALGDLIGDHKQKESSEPDPDVEADRNLDQALRDVASVPYRVAIGTSAPYMALVTSDGIDGIPADVEFAWRLLTRPTESFAGIPGSMPTEVEDLALSEITPYIVVTARDSRGTRAARSTVVLADLTGDPADRLDAIVASHLQSPADFVRFLTLLLELAGIGTTGAGGGGAWIGTGDAGGVGAGLFESLIRAVGAGSSGLADVASVVEYLRRSGREEVLPAGFDALWHAVWSAHRELDEGRD